jgi:hypothetical protein
MNMKVLCFFETNNFGHYAILIRDRFLPQNRPAKYRQVFDRIVLESSDPTHPNSTQTRVLDVNPALFIAREVQPILIYVRGVGRLNQHQSNKHIYNFSVFIYPYTLVSCFSFFVFLQVWRLRIHEALGAVRPT